MRPQVIGFSKESNSISCRQHLVCISSPYSPGSTSEYLKWISTSPLFIPTTPSIQQYI
jgi:hypothetical protein